MTLLCLLIAFALGPLPARAQASTTVIAPPEASAPYQQWVDEALVATPSVELHVVIARCPAVGGIYDAADGCYIDPVIYLRPRIAAHKPTFYHELGHAFDRHSFTDEGRLAFRRLVKMTAWPWHDSIDNQGVWSAGLEEDFAEGYAMCASRRAIRQPRWLVLSRISPARYQRLCRLINYPAEGT